MFAVPKLVDLFRNVLIQYAPSREQPHITSVTRDVQFLWKRVYKMFVSNPRVNADSSRKIPSGRPNDLQLRVAQKIVKRCVDVLCVPDDPVVLCVRMQLILEHDYRDKEFVVNKINEENGRRIGELVDKIVDDVGLQPCDRDESSEYYRRIVQYVILTNYMGDPTSPACIRETSAILNIAVSPEMLMDFGNELQSFKRKRLKELADLVCGLRLYTMDRKTSYKEEIFNMIDTLPKAVDLLLKNFDQELENCLKNEVLLTLQILQCYKVDNDFFAPLFAIRTHLATISSDELDKYKTVLLICLQYKKNLKAIKRDLNKCKIEFYEALKKYETSLGEIKHSFENGSSVEDMVPELVNMSAIWNQMIEMMNYLSTTTNLLMTMKQMINKLQTIGINDQIESSLTTGVLYFPAVSDDHLKIIETHPLHPTCKWYPYNVHTVDRKNLFAQGYCIVMIVETDGTLLKRNKHAGTIQFMDQWFGFTSVQAALHFGTKPSYYLNGFHYILRTRVPLLFFFHLHEKMTDKKYIDNNLMCEKYNTVKYSNAQVQTVLYEPKTHTIRGYFDHTQKMKHCIHQSNEVPKTTTRSAQTVDVYKSIYVQTDSCDVGCNTTKEKGTNTYDQSINAQMIKYK